MELPGRGPAKHGVHGALLSKIFVFITPGQSGSARSTHVQCARSDSLLSLWWKADLETSALSPLVDERIVLDGRGAMGLVFNHRCRHRRRLGAAKADRRPRGQDWQSHPVQHRRLLAKTLVLSSCGQFPLSPA